MSQFRNTADILDEILRKAGETTNGNSPYEARALTYANHAHHAIVGGGSIFDLEVNESWPWARSKQPIVFDLLPPYVTGTITFTEGDINITFSNAPTVSLEGWHVQVSGYPTVYRIMQHSAAGTQAQLDSNFVNPSGAYTFRAFKLDYEIFPAFVYVDNKNDKIDFQETAAVTLTATLQHGSYTPANLISHIVTKIGAVGTATWSGSYDTVARSFAVTCSVTAKLLGASGTNARRSGLKAIGFDVLDYTGAQSYVSTYVPNSVSRLIEPFKIFGSNTEEPFIYSSDPVRMQEDFPVSQTEQRIPDRFCFIEENNDGVVKVRFNSYPRARMRVEVDWIPVPVDLQDNTASVVLLPRSEVSTLIHAAAAYIAFDKEDSKFDAFIKLANSGIEAMKERLRDRLFNTGEIFGQVVPRADYSSPRRRLKYGYTVSAATSNTTAESTQRMIEVDLSYSQFQTAALSSVVVARTLPANRTLFALIVKHSQVFTGAGIATLALDVGISGDPTKFINGFNPAQAVSAGAQDSSLVLFFPAAATDIQVRLTATGANLNQLNQGNVTLYFQESVTT